MSFPTYEMYKDSRIAWLGEVPTHWKVVRTGSLEHSGSDFVSGPFGSALGSNDYVDEGIPVIRGVNTTLGAERRFVPKRFVFVNELKFRELSRCDARPGDLVFTARGTVGKVGIVPDEVPQALISPNQLRYRPKNPCVNADYLFYLFSSNGMLSEIAIAADSVAQPNLNLGNLKSLRIPIPPLAEQFAIASFLDRETAKINLLIEEQHRLIELLKEKLRSTISNTIAKGLDLNRPMKQAGGKWLREVPKHWDVAPLRHFISRIFNGLTSPQIESDTNTVAVTRIETISDGTVNEDKLGYIRSQDARENMLLRPGDILFSNINSLNVIGNCAKYIGTSQIYAGMNLLTLRPAKSVNADWLHWVIKSAVFRQEVESLAKPAINQASISQASLLGIPVPRPPAHEQLAIAAHLARETERIQELTAEAKSGIDFLRERRGALIALAVTGKIDVRSTGSQQAAAE